MNKDVLLATLIGLGLGLIITTIVILGPKALAYLPQLKLPSFNFQMKLPTGVVPQAPESTPSTQVPTGLSILTPKPEAIELKNSTEVSGLSEPGSVIVIQGFTNEVVITSESDGAYTGEIKLTEGKNDITVTSYKDEKQTTQRVTVYYTTEKL